MNDRNLRNHAHKFIFRKNTILNLEQFNKSWLKSQGASLKVTWLLWGAQHLSKDTIFLLTAYHRIQVLNIYRSLWLDPYPYPLFPNVNINTTKRWLTEPNITTQLFSFSSSLICENIVLWQGSVHGKPDLPSESSIFRYKICKDNEATLGPVDTSFGRY